MTRLSCRMVRERSLVLRERSVVLREGLLVLRRGFREPRGQSFVMQKCSRALREHSFALLEEVEASGIRSPVDGGDSAASDGLRDEDAFPGQLAQSLEERASTPRHRVPSPRRAPSSKPGRGAWICWEWAVSRSSDAGSVRLVETLALMLAALCFMGAHCITTATLEAIPNPLPWVKALEGRAKLVRPAGMPAVPGGATPVAAPGLSEEPCPALARASGTRPGRGPCRSG